MPSKQDGRWLLSEDEEDELLTNLDTSGPFVTVTFESGRRYTVGIRAATWLNDGLYLQKATQDGSELSTEDMYGSDLQNTEYA